MYCEYAALRTMLRGASVVFIEFAFDRLGVTKAEAPDWRCWNAADGVDTRARIAKQLVLI